MIDWSIEMGYISENDLSMAITMSMSMSMSMICGMQDMRYSVCGMRYVTAACLFWKGSGVGIWAVIGMLYCTVCGAICGGWSDKWSEVSGACWHSPSGNRPHLPHKAIVSHYTAHSPRPDSDLRGFLWKIRSLLDWAIRKQRHGHSQQKKTYNTLTRITTSLCYCYCYL